MEDDIGLVLGALVNKAKADLEAWEKTVEQHMGRVMVIKESYQSDEHLPETPLGVRLIHYGGEKKAEQK